MKLYPPTISGSKEMFKDFEQDFIETKTDWGREDPHDQAIEQEIEFELEGQHPEIHGDSPGINMIADPKYDQNNN